VSTATKWLSSDDQDAFGYALHDQSGLKTDTCNLLAMMLIPFTAVP
jgi:hypothetical protein